ncbi:hypothetical protein [Actinomyces faecalis]|uniref:hypothetical protein n=1 Tax=Actinomyces faecalis TaxID=2722820 RepID=UPI001884A26A|nr:hypothetical protein [Actinomyces faecalis]
MARRQQRIILGEVEARAVFRVSTYDEEAGQWDWAERDGQPRWAVDVILPAEPDQPGEPGPHQRDEVITVKLDEEPEDVDPGDVIVLEGAMVGAWASGGQSGLYYTARRAVSVEE